MYSIKVQTINIIAQNIKSQFKNYYKFSIYFNVFKINIDEIVDNTIKLCHIFVFVLLS